MVYAMSESQILVRLDLFRLAVYLAKKKKARYVRIRDLAEMLGVSTRSAGKLLARMEDHGLARRYSNTVYEVLYGLEELDGEAMRS
jgi:Mn-dependent DtxR family transcriptional regulator